MASAEDSLNDNKKFKVTEKTLLFNTIQIMDEEKQTILSEALKCDICLELPKGKQVRICEKGHHFCGTCHKKMKACGICRGKLLEGRNFVVEQLVTKLGPVLGLTDNDTPIQTPPRSIPGSFKCLHHCSAKLPSSRMLSHLRQKHSKNLLEKVICNPYSNRFSLKYSIIFNANERYIYSAYVSDLGLCTVEIFFIDLDFHGCVRLLLGDSEISQFRYQLVVKVPTSQMILEYGITDCIVSKYSEDRNSVLKQGNLLKIKSNVLLENIKEGHAIDVFFSIWKKSEPVEGEKIQNPSITCLPEKLLHMENDRRLRRNKSRNFRRKRLRTNFQNLTISSIWRSSSSDLFDNVAF